MAHPPTSFRLDVPRAAGILGFLAAAILAVVARGMAGDEEVSHYLIARYSLEDPELLLSLAGRPFVNLVLALPSQAGILGARLASALATGACAYAVARTVRSAGLGSPVAAAAFLLVQPFFLAHAGTAMTEPWAAALLAWMILAYTERRARLLVLLAAVAPLARLEMLPFWFPVVWILWRERPRRWILFLPVPLLVLNGFGALASGDPLWLLHQSRWQAYPERELLHYLRSFVWIAGLGVFPAILTGLSHAALRRIRERRGPSRAPVPDAAARALDASAFTALALFAVYSGLAALHPITYGNLRYLAYAAPAFALLATTGVRVLIAPPAELPRLAWSGPVLALAGAALVWNHPLLRDFAVLVRHDWLPAIAALGWLGIFAAARSAPGRGWAVALPLLIVAINLGDGLGRHRETLHLEPNPEHAAVVLAAQALPDPLPAGARLVAAHPLLALERGQNPYDPVEWPPLTDRVTVASPPGTIFFWDTHYVSGKKPSLELLSILQSKAWRYGAGFVAADSAWAGAYLVRSGPGDEAVLAAFRPGIEEHAWYQAARRVQYGIHSGRQNILADPGNDEYWRVLAQRLFAAGFADEAWKVLAQAERLDPDDARNAAYRAEFHRHRKEYDRATEAARDAVAKDPKNGVFQYLMGRLLLDQSRVDEAVPHLVEASKRLSNRWDTQYVTGVALFDLGRHPEAEPYLEKAARLNPNDWKPARQLAENAWRIDRKEEAMARVRTFSSRRPEMAQPYILLGDMLAALGRVDEARAVWEDGMEKTGGDPEIASRLEPAAPPAGP